MSPEQPATPFQPGAFGRYDLIERLAVGGMAEIFRAKQTGAHGFEKILVIKRILPHLAADPEFFNMFVDEAKLQCSLQHPKIVQVLEFGQVDGQYFIALEFVDGMDALGLLRECAHRKQRLPVRLAVHIASEMLDALDYAHSIRGPDGAPLGIVHRDVSPSNVFISRRGDVKLGDFGIARADASRQSKTQAGTLKGKYGYMAPEQVVGQPVDGRSDLFAVGIVLAEMLMGRRLFTAANDLDVLLMVRDAKLERLDRYGTDIAPPLREILNKMLARDPTIRYQRCGEARDALQDFLFQARQRVSAADLGAFLEALKSEASTEALTAPRPPTDRSQLLMGEDTRARREAAQRQLEVAAQMAREPAMQARAREVERGMTPPLPPVARGSAPAPTIEVEPSIIIEADTGPFIEPASDPRFGSGARPAPPTPPPQAVPPAGGPPISDVRSPFGEMTPARLFGRLAAERETGLLVVELGEVKKEIYLVDGAPEFVSSNVPSERFGEYLVAKGVISAGELSMALAILPRFQGKLGDTLVGLNLLRPLEVFRLLSRQVREKIIDVFIWTSGSYQYFRGRTNQHEAFPLGLDAFEILGAGVAGLPLEIVRGRLDRVAAKRVRRVEKARPSPDQFRVGAGPRELWQRLDGKRTVGDWLKRYDQPEQLITLCRTLYLLIESELATLE